MEEVNIFLSCCEHPRWIKGVLKGSHRHSGVLCCSVLFKDSSKYNCHTADLYLLLFSHYPGLHLHYLKVPDVVPKSLRKYRVLFNSRAPDGTWIQQMVYQSTGLFCICEGIKAPEGQRLQRRVTFIQAFIRSFPFITYAKGIQSSAGVSVKGLSEGLVGIKVVKVASPLDPKAAGLWSE